MNGTSNFKWVIEFNNWIQKCTYICEIVQKKPYYCCDFAVLKIVHQHFLLT